MQALVDLGCPREKLIMGVPFYAKTFTLSPGNNHHEIGTPVDKMTGAGKSGIYTQEAGTLAYYEVCSSLIGKDKNGWVEDWDSEGLCPYMYKGIILYAYSVD